MSAEDPQPETRCSEVGRGQGTMGRGEWGEIAYLPDMGHEGSEEVDLETRSRDFSAEWCDEK